MPLTTYTVGRKKFRQLNLAAEATPGTLATMTRPWRGPVDGPEDMRKLTEVEENIGIIGDTDRSYIAEASSSVTVPSVAMSFEQFPYLLFFNNWLTSQTGTADPGTGVGATGKVYTATVPTTFAATPLTTLQTASIEVGDDFEQETITYAVCNHIEISGNMGEAVKVSSKWMGRPVVRKGTVGFSAVTIPAVEDIIASKGTLYLDPIGTSYGTTAVSNSIISFKITLDVTYTGIYPVGTTNTTYQTTDFTSPANYGYPLYSNLVYTGHKIGGDLVFLNDTPISGNIAGSGQLAKVAWRQQLAKHMRLSLAGNPLVQTITSGSPTYTTKMCIFDFPIKHSKISALGDKGGADTYTFTWFSKYNLTSAEAGKITTVLDGVTTLGL